MNEQLEHKNAEQPRAELVIEALLTNGKIKVSSPEGIEGFSLRGYGVSENGELILAFHEAMYLISREILEVKDGETGKGITFQDVLRLFQSQDETAWVKYLIYRDLRSRGYVVREGFGLDIDFRVYKRGDYGDETAKYMIFGMQEGQPVTLAELARAQMYVQGLKKRLVLAVVNRRGEVVYYSLSQLTLK